METLKRHVEWQNDICKLHHVMTKLGTKWLLLFSIPMFILTNMLVPLKAIPVLLVLVLVLVLVVLAKVGRTDRDLAMLILIHDTLLERMLQDGMKSRNSVLELPGDFIFTTTSTP